MEDAYIFCISCRTQSFVHYCANNTFHIQRLTIDQSRKVQLAGISTCSVVLNFLALLISGKISLMYMVLNMRSREQIL